MLGKSYRDISVMMAGAMAVSLCLFSQPKPALAAEPVNEIEISVGYYGAKSYTKKTIYIDELDDRLTTRQQIYTWINEEQNCGTTEAEGIYLSDLLKSADIDMDSVYSYDFLPDEPRDDTEETEAMRQWESQELFEGTDGDRYSFASVFQLAREAYDNCEDSDDYRNHPDDYFTTADFFDYVTTHAYNNTAWNYRIAVNPMLALKERSEVWEKGALPPTNLDFTGLETQGTPVLMAGQASVDDVSNQDVSPVVTRVNVWFDGAPQISIDKKSLKGEVGSKEKISAKVSTPDATLTVKIRSEIKFASSNPAVATVDDDGNVEIKSEGTATITAWYDSDGDGKEESFGSASVTGTAKSDSSGDDGNSGSGGSGNGGSGESGGTDNNSSSGSGTGGTSESGGSGNSGGQGINYSSGGGSQSGSRSSGTGQTVSFTPQRTTVTNTTPRTFTGTGSPDQTVAPLVDTSESLDSSDASGETSLAATEDGVDYGDSYISYDGTTEEDLFEEEGSVLAVNGVGNPAAQSGSGTGTGRKTVVLSLLAGIIAIVCGMIFATWNYWNETEWVNRAKKLVEKQG